MRSSFATVALAGAIGLTGLGGAAVLAPAVSYAATGDSTALTTSLKEALSGLVSDGSITQAQADEVATTLAEARPFAGGRGGRGGFGGRVDLGVAAEALGLTEDELRTRTQAGETLGQVADAEDVDRSALVEALVQAQQERLDQAVADGRLTQAQADERAATLTERVTASLDELCGPGGRAGRGLGGPGDDADDADEAPATPAPAPSADSSTSTTSADA